MDQLLYANLTEKNEFVLAGVPLIGSADGENMCLHIDRNPGDVIHRQAKPFFQRLKPLAGIHNRFRFLRKPVNFRIAV